MERTLEGTHDCAGKGGAQESHLGTCSETHDTSQTIGSLGEMERAVEARQEITSNHGQGDTSHDENVACSLPI